MNPLLFSQHNFIGDIRTAGFAHAYILSCFRKICVCASILFCCATILLARSIRSYDILLGDLDLGDGTVKIFVNAQGICGKINSELRSFIEYLRGDDASSILTKTIDERIDRLKRNERWRGEFMTLYENYQYERNEGRKEGRVEGREEGRRELCVSMVRDGVITPIVAAEKLGISEEAFIKLLEETEK